MEERVNRAVIPANQMAKVARALLPTARSCLIIMCIFGKIVSRRRCKEVVPPETTRPGGEVGKIALFERNGLKGFWVSLTCVEPLMQKTHNQIRVVDAEILAVIRQQVMLDLLSIFLGCPILEERRSAATLLPPCCCQRPTWKCNINEDHKQKKCMSIQY
nr:vacuolar protein sorting-associated protein 53 A-like [Tanacetum cinerariifolium]